MAGATWCFLLLLVVVCPGALRAKVYLNKWAVEIPGGDNMAHYVANQHGFRNLGKIGSLENFYLFEHHEVMRRSVSPARHHHSYLRHESKVVWVEQQVVHKRVKRDYISDSGWSPHLVDPDWTKQWYLHGGARGGYDMNVLGAWERGYTGKGVVITILDDGIERNHPDLINNYDPMASRDINDNDDDPMPRYDKNNENRHGTRCAGEVSATVNNSACGAGVAYHSNIGGVRMLDGEVSDYVEAEALSLRPDYIDIYSASWGPDDNGKVVDGPAKLAREAFVTGVLKGRGGKGSLYVWASGNGGSQQDSCSCDGYTNSIFTLSVGSADEKGSKPWYLEECASTLAATYSSGKNYGQRKVVTTDLHEKCTDGHTGTSASAPIAAAMCALALEANPELSWRDMQHVVMLTSRTEPLMDGQWVTNGVGRQVSHRYGYGMMDGEAMVRLAERWTTVPEQHICQSALQQQSWVIEGNSVSVSVDMDGCAGQENQVTFLEHVQAKVTLEYSRRGDLQIHLLSPNGTRSTLLPNRKNDYREGDFDEWPFMSVFYWGERPHGTWTLLLENTGTPYNSGFLKSWQLILYGTATYPVKLRQPKPRKNKPGRKTKPGVSNSKDKERSGSIDSSNERGPSGEGIDHVKIPPYLKHKDTDKPIVDYGMEEEEEGNYGVEEDGYTDLGEVEESVDYPPDMSEEMEEGTDWLPGWYEQEHMQGIPCHEECVQSAGCTGTGADECMHCQHYRLGDAGACVSSCPVNAFFLPGNNVCYRCLEPCSTCTGPDSAGGDCLSCMDDMVLIADQGLCVRQCPEGYYLELDGVSECRQCSPECATCSGGSQNCDSCSRGYELQSHTCVLQCSSNQYRNHNGRCDHCGATCETCSGRAPDHCLTCDQAYVYLNGSCLLHCPQGYYLEHSKPTKQCVQCHPSCKECTAPTEQHCTRCTPPLKLMESTCTESCLKGHYEDESGHCQPCHSSCLTCISPHPDQCLTCPDNALWQEGSCVENCFQNYYIDQSEDRGSLRQQCRPCHASCASCQGPEPKDCISCHSMLYFSQGLCKSECSENEFESAGECLPCHTECHGCWGGASTQCAACPAGRVFLRGECLLACPLGHYPDPQAQCMRCHHTCLSCTGGGVAACTSCDLGYDLSGGMCLEAASLSSTAPASTGPPRPHIESHKPEPPSPTRPAVFLCERRQYYSDNDGVCHLCDPSCDSCRGPGPANCLSCSPPRRYYQPGHQCLLCCTSTLRRNCCHCQNTPQDECVIAWSGAISSHLPDVHYFEPTTTSAKFATSFTILTTTSGDTRAVGPGMSGAASQLSGVLGLVAFFCVISVVTFFVIFGLLQARTSERLCWRTHYEPVPTFYQNGKDHVTLSSKDYVDEDELYSSA